MFNRFFIPKSCLLLGLALSYSVSSAQNVGINSSGNTPDASAGLDIDFSNKGLLIPRVKLTGTEDVKTVPLRSISLLVFNTDPVNDVTTGYYYWDGTKWIPLATGSANLWGANGSTIYYSLGKVGLGTSSVDNNRLFDVAGQAGLKGLTMDYLNDGAVDRPSLVFGGGGSGEGFGSKRIGAGSNSYGIDFYTSHASRMTVTNAGNIGIGTLSPHASSALDVSSATKGLLIPNVSLTSTTASSPISSPLNSLLVFNKATINDVNPGYYYWSSSSLRWIRLGEGSSGENPWTISGLNIYSNASTQKVGIGNTTPTESLDVGGNVIIGSTTNAGRLKISNSVGNAELATDIFTEDDNRTLRFSNAGIGQEGASLQLKPKNENYLFSFEGKSGFRYYSRNTGIGESFKVYDNGSVKINTVPSTGEKKAITALGSTNSAYGFSVQNQSNGAEASSEISAVHNLGSENGGYVKMGIRSTKFNKGTVLNAEGMAYMYSNAGTLAIGNSSHNNPLIFFTNSTDPSSGGSDAAGTERLRILGNGNIGIGDFSVGDYGERNPSAKLTIDGNTEPKATALYDLGSSNKRWKTVYSQDILNTSDRRLKTNIVNASYGLKDVMSLRPVFYNWKASSDTGRQVGLIAQEVRAVIPESVKGDEEKENLSMNYNALIPVLINAIKEQQQQIDQLKEQIKLLQNK